MGKALAPIKLNDGSIFFVEVEEMDETKLVSLQKEISKLSSDAHQEEYQALPPDAQLVSSKEKIKDALEIIKDSMSGVINSIHEGLSKSTPDEWGVELSFGFKGKVNPIPVVVSGESNVAIKIHAKWKKH